MKNIIVIADGTTKHMIHSSLKSNVNVILYLEFEKYWELPEKDMLHQKKMLLEQLLAFVKTNTSPIDYIFSFVARRDLYFEEELADWVLESLKTLGFPHEKIIDGWRIYRSLYPLEAYKRKMSNPNISELDGIVFGISHAETGIRADCLPGSACNLASSSADLYFNYYTAQQVWNSYAEKVKNLKYIIIDMFDYTYFNFETMYTGATLNFLEHSGIECPKEWDDLEYKIINNTRDEINDYLKTKWPLSTSDEKNLLGAYFENLIENDENAYFGQHTVDGIKRLSLDEISEYENSPTIASIQRNIFEHSIEKNVQHLYDLLSFLYKNAPHAKIILCLLPKYKLVEDFEKTAFPDWKIFFENILSDMQQKVPFIYWNFKEDEDISWHPEYYWDITHLNDDGARAFTAKISDKINMLLQ